MDCVRPYEFWCRIKFVAFKMILLLLLLNIVDVRGFNIEERYPIIKSGPEGSLFGFSIAQHHITADSTSEDNAQLLVGAPTGPAYGEDVRSGALYNCSVLSNDNCTVVPILPPTSRRVEDATNQWLGVSVKSYKPGGQIMTCAHRYVIKGYGWRAPIGRCFLLEPDATPVADNLEAEYVPCQSEPDRDGGYTHGGYGYCQAGTSVNFADHPPGEAGKPTILIGAPGSVHWSGSILAVIRGNALWGLGVEQLWSEIIDLKNSQIGSSMVSGFIYKNNKINYVSGAPGANATGSVYIFEKETPDIDDPNSGDPFLRIVEVVEGDKVASRFGHDILLTDVTGDGKLDLIVGAPQFYDRTDQVGGAVYVYINKGSSRIGPAPSQKLFGKIDSYFGMAIASAGDVNLDGADDIVIGAPGEEGWSGVVYLYHGDNTAETVGVRSTPSQVIKAKKVAALRGIYGFGYSISGGLDMDFNGYPDLAVGSLSDSAVVLFSRPIVNITGSISGPDNKIELTEGPSEQVLNVTICLQYTALPPSFNDRVRVVGEVLLDATRVESGLLSRLTFERSLKENVAKKEFTMTLHRQSAGKPKCQTMKTYMKNDVRDKLSPIELKLVFDTSNIPPKRRRRRRDTTTRTPPIPIMNSAISNSSVSEIEFAKRCGEDEICESNLKQSAYYQILKNGNWTDLKQQREGDPLLVLGTEEQIGLVIDITNKNGEDAHQAMMNIVLPEEVTYRRIEMMSGNAIHCDLDAYNQSLVVCHLGNPFKEETSVKFRLRMSKTKSIQKATHFAVRLQLLTTSQQKVPDPGVEYLVHVEVEAQLVLSGFPSKEQVNFAGKVVGESAIHKPSDAGTLHVHSYNVKNSGTGIVEDVALKIKWPQTIPNGKWLFYLIGAEVDGFGNCTIPDNVDPLKLGNAAVRKKREASDPPGNLIVKSVSPDYATLSCLNGGVLSCTEIICHLGDIASKATVSVELTAILWNSTFLEEYSNVSGVYVTSFAEVSILQENIKFSEKSRLEEGVTTTVLPFEIFVPEQKLEWWIIAVAGAAGVILLVFLVLIMWKCGFFKRQTHVDYQKARRHKQASKKVEEKETLY